MNAITTQSARATAEDWSRFMRPIALAVRNVPADDDFRSRVAAIAHAVAVPAEWLRQPWRQADAMRKFQFWPAVSDVFDLFADDLRAERERADRRERLSGPTHISKAIEFDGPAIRTPEEIEAVKAKARALAAELTHSSPQQREPVRPVHASDGALLVVYEQLAAQGNAAAAFRAEALRKRLEGAER